MEEKKALLGEGGSGVGRPGAEEEPDARRGLSKEAWVAISAMAAALITGTVTLLTHLLPQTTPQASPQAPSAASPDTPATAATAPSPSAVVTADAIAGRWAGTAEDGNDTSFEITLDVGASCALGERCGSIGVSHVPCYGEVFLEAVQDGEFELRVANFHGESDHAVCQPGAGELSKLRPDGKLAYTTTYEPVAQGVLVRVEG